MLRPGTIQSQQSSSTPPPSNRNIRSPTVNIKSDLLSRVIPHLTTLLLFLIDTVPYQAAQFLVDSASTQFVSNAPLVGYAVKDLLKRLKKKSDQITTKDFRNIFTSHDPKVWSQVIIATVRDSQPQFLPAPIRLQLFTLLSTQGDRIKAKDFRKILRGLDYERYTALGEICSLVSHTFPDSAGAAAALGPALLLMNESDQGERNAAIMIMTKMILLCNSIFPLPKSDYSEMSGVSANSGQSGKNPSNIMGLRGLHSHGASLKMFEEGSSAKNKRKQHLRLFYELRDKKYLTIVDLLFNYYNFVDIAEGIYRKYGCLPIGWKEELDHLKLQWYDPQRILFLDETTQSYPGVNKQTRFPERKQTEILDQVVDEFILSEKIYYDKMSTFYTNYVLELQAICQGKIGEEAANALMLTQKQVDFVFGQVFKEVINSVEKLLITLEVLCLVKKPVTHKGGRAAVLAELVYNCGDMLTNAYAPYNARFATFNNIIQAGTEAVKSKKKKKEPLTLMRHLNFLELWQEITRAKQILKAKQLDTMLNEPVRRFPNYKVFFERMKKEAAKNKDEAASQKIEKALTLIMDLTQKIDNNVNSNMKIEEKFFAQA